MKYFTIYFTTVFIIGLFTSIFSIYGSTLKYRCVDCEYYYSNILTHSTIFLIFGITNLISNNILTIIYFILIKYFENQREIRRKQFEIFYMTIIIFSCLDLVINLFLNLSLFQLKPCYGIYFESLKMFIFNIPYFVMIKTMIFSKLLEWFMKDVMRYYESDF